MKTSHTLSAAVLGASGLLAASALGQAKSPPVAVQSNSTSSVIEVTQFETAPQRIANLKLPAGFTISKFAEMYNPRMILTRPNGDVYISQRAPGTMVLLKDLNKDGKADVQKVVATRKWMHGMAVKGNTMFFMTIRDLYSAPIKKDGTLGKIAQIAADFPDAGQHPNRTMNFGPDGRLYISVGSTTNAANEPNEENATLIVYDVEKRERHVYASGLRNTIGFGWHPPTKKFIGWDQGMDTLGDNASKEEINEILPGKRYGWPFVYEDGKLMDHPLPPAGYTREDWSKSSQKPRLMHTAHSAGMEMQFYKGTQFPAEYRNDAFIPLRGSWNRNPPSGYYLARIHFNDAGQPVSVTPFVSGFLLENPSPTVKWGHFGRLAGLAQHADGSMLLSDDTNNIVYRIAYGAANTPRKLSQLDSRKITFELPQTQNASGTIKVVSSTFKNMDGLPLNATAYGKNVSPDLRWSGVPKSAKSLVLMMEDPDSLSPKPFPHWLMANISPRATSLKSGIPNVEMPGLGAMQGSNNTSNVGYFGPKPPADGVKHRYNFQIFALNSKLNLPSGYNRQALLDAMQGKVLAKGKIVGLYQRNPF